MTLRRWFPLTAALPFILAGAAYGWRLGYGAPGMWIFLLCLAAMSVMRAAFASAASHYVVKSQVDRREAVIIAAAFLCFTAIPVLHFATPVFARFDYAAPGYFSAPGAMLCLAGLWMFRQSHVQLGRHWSPSLELRRGHRLVTSGLYAHVRHPMYASVLLFSAGQALLVPNAVAGPSGLLLFALLYGLRLDREEAMLAECFGPGWADYAGRTGRIVPRLRRQAQPAVQQAVRQVSR